MLRFLSTCCSPLRSPSKTSRNVLLLGLLKVFFLTNLNAQNCSPVSLLPCEDIQVSLPFSLTFDNPVSNTMPDNTNQGTGFTMVQNYSGTRHTQDATAPDANIPGYLPSKLLLSDGRLQLTTSKGINYLTNNNQINALGVSVDSHDKILVKADIVNPFYGTQSQQAGIWFGANDKSFVKLVIVENKVELRREANDISSSGTGLQNPDVRVTSTMAGLNTRTVGLKLVIDPVTNTTSGFYSLDNGSTFINVGKGYADSSISISGMGITGESSYTGLFASHRNADKAVTYNFDNFSVTRVLQFDSTKYTFNVTDNSSVGAFAGTVSASSTDGSPVSYRIQSGNNNSAFSINESTGNIMVNKKLNYHTQSEYNLTVVSEASHLTDIASVLIRVSPGVNPTPNFTGVNWTKAAFQPYKVSESQGEVVNGKLYTFGGFDSQKSTFTPTKRSYVYDPAADTWTRIADLPHTPNGPNFGGITHAGSANDGTDIYFSGGYTSNTAGTGQVFGTKQVWKYNVASNTYTRLPDLPVQIAAGQLEYVNGRLHHIGGTNPARTMDLGNHYVLDLDNLAAGWKNMTPLPNPRQHAGAAVYEGKIYYIGGQNGHDSKLVTRKDVHRYDPQTGSWTKMADLLAPGSFGLGHISSSVVVMGNRIIVLGGEAVHHTQQSAMVSAYSPSDNTWKGLTPLPVTRFSGVAGVLNGNLYYTGGSNGSTTFKGIPVTGNALARMSGEVTGDNSTKAGGSAEKRLMIFPNPVLSNGYIQMENFEKHENVRVSIVNLLGQEIMLKNCVADENGRAATTIDEQFLRVKSTYIIKAEALSGSCLGRLVVP